MTRRLNRMNGEIRKLDDKSKIELAANGIEMLPRVDDVFTWDVKISGPKGTPFEGGIFYLSFNAPALYPIDPPIVKFITPIYHMNISRAGSVCISILESGNWSHNQTFQSVALSIVSLLDDPNPESPFQPDIAQEYLRDRKEYERKAREHTLLQMELSKGCNKDNAITIDA